MEYREFKLRIGPHLGADPSSHVPGGPAAEYPVMASSPAGDAEGTFVIPFTPDELERLPAAFCPFSTEKPLPPEDVGAKLFTALLGGEVGKLFATGLGRLEAHAERLRVDLHLAPEPALLALPWELLRDPATGYQLALHRRISLVRCLDVRRPKKEVSLPSSLRVLVVSSGKERPSLALDDETLALDDELRLLEAALAKVEGATVETLELPRLGALREKLREGSFHVLHYMGHGRFLHGEQGRIQLEAADGEIDEVSGHDLATGIGDVSALQLVVLNACGSGRDGGKAAPQPFAGVATALVQAGLPAVVAVQESITDEAALAFSGAFYERLAAGDPVETAVVEGRMAIFNRSKSLRDEAEWALPVLYRRAAGGELVLTSPPPREKPAWRALATALVGLVAVGSLVFALLRPWLGPSRPVDDTPASASTTPRSLIGEEPSALLLSEIFANPDGDDAEHEWIELVNPSSEPIDLAGYSIAGGGDGYIWSIPLSGIVEPGSTFVLGGPYSDKSNANPRFDDPRNLYSRLQNGGLEADGIALFDVPSVQLTPRTVPIDAVIYGGANTNGLVDETGTAGPPDVGAPQEGSSIIRLDRAGSWALSSVPTPNASPLLDAPGAPPEPSE